VADYTQLPDRLLRLPEVKTRTGLGRSSIYRLVATGAFPRPRKLAERAVAWRASEIETWIESRPINAGQN
jgi:prophage regulatory protein